MSLDEYILRITIGVFLLFALWCIIFIVCYIVMVHRYRWHREIAGRGVEIRENPVAEYV
jgi:hypothetical protein